MSNLVDIIQGVISNINLIISVKEVVGNKIYIYGSTLHLTIGKLVEIDDLSFEVTDFEINKWIEVEPYNHEGVIPDGIKEIKATEITFLHGDPYSVNSEYLELNHDTTKKTPFIWLLDDYSEDDLPIDSAFESSYKCRLFFLDWANENLWSNDQHNNRVIKPMQNLRNAFVDTYNKNFSLNSIGNSNTFARARFGVKVKGGSSTSKIIDEDLSGVDVNINVQEYEGNSCLFVPDESCKPATIVDSDGITKFEVESGGVGYCKTLESINVSNSDDTYSVDTIFDLVLPDISFTDSDGSVTSLPSVKDIKATQCEIRGGIAYEEFYHNNSKTSIDLYDEAWLIANGAFEYSRPISPIYTQRLDNSDNTGRTLAHPNHFGNYNRFSNSDGTQSPMDGTTYTIDNLTNIARAPTKVTSSFNGMFGSGGYIEDFNNNNTHGYSDWFVNTAAITWRLSEQDPSQGGSLMYKDIGHCNTATPLSTYNNLSLYLNQTARLWHQPLDVSRSFIICRIHFK